MVRYRGRHQESPFTHPSRPKRSFSSSLSNEKCTFIRIKIPALNISSRPVHKILDEKYFIRKLPAIRLSHATTPSSSRSIAILSVFHFITFHSSFFYSIFLPYLSFLDAAFFRGRGLIHECQYFPLSFHFSHFL